MHTESMDDSEGEFGEWRRGRAGYCVTSDGCDNPDVWIREWDSDCGGYTDYQLKCRNCGRVKWVEGADS